MTRTDAREAVMKLLFEMEAQRRFGAAMIERFLREQAGGDAQQEYFQKMTDLIASHLKETDRLIESRSEKWKIERLNKVDLAVIRVAVLEMFFMDDIPDAVSIHEAVEIAKKYGAEESGKFVNGLLGAVARLKDAYVRPQKL